jgi:uncharacterized protein (TIGR03083 family)
VSRLEPLTPVDTTGLFAPLGAELVALLRGLAESDWSKPTVAGDWSVKDVAGHLLDGQLRKLAFGRDANAHYGRAPASGAYGDVVAFIDELNRTGVGYAARLSPRLLSDLLEVAGDWVARYVESLPPEGEARFAVDWAGEARSTNWMDVGREYTEHWHHQMQIRDAVGAPGLFQPRWLDPLLDLSVRAFPRAYRELSAPAGSAVGFEVRGEPPRAWSVVREVSGWVVMRGRAERPAASVQADADTAWRLLYNALPPEAARARLTIAGDAALIEPLLRARSVMV